MTPARRLRELLDRLATAEVRFVIVGGLAVNAWGHVRGTQDVDLVPDPDRGNLDRLASVLEKAGDKVETAQGRLAASAIRTFLAAGDRALVATDLGPVDVLQGLPQIPPYSQLDAEAVAVDLGGERYVEHLAHVKQRKRTTIQDYRGYLRRHLVPHFGERKLDRIEPAHVEAYLHAKLATLSPKTVTNHLTFLHGLFGFAVRRRWAESNPVAARPRRRGRSARPGSAGPRGTPAEAERPHARRPARQHHALRAYQRRISSARLYWENKSGFFAAKGVTIPVGVSTFPDEIYRVPRSWAEQAYPNLVYYNQHDRGGHFAAWEQPQLLSEDVRATFRSLR